MFGLDAKSGVEVPETSPHWATSDAVRAAMGQTDQQFTVTQLARYVSTIANGGTCYDLTLVDKISDSTGSVLEEQEPTVRNTVDLPDSVWNSVKTGMRGVVQNHTAFENFNQVAVAGKTGTTQERTDVANHGTFIGFAPYDQSEPDIAITVRIANGYTSANAALVARDVIAYYYGLEDKDTLITGHASTPVSNYERTD